MVRRFSGTRLSPLFCLLWLMAIGAAASLEAEMICGAPLEAAVPLLDAITGGLEDGNVQAFETAGHTCCDMLKEATVAAHGIAESTGQANAFIDAAAQIATKGNLKSSCARIVLVEVVAGMPLPAEPNLEEMANETAAVETKEEAIATAANQPTAVATQRQPPPPAVAKTSSGSNSPPGSPRPPQSKSPPATQQTRSRAAAAKSGSGASNSNANAAQPRVSSGNGQQQRGNSAPQQASRGQLNQPPGAGVSPPGKRGV